MQEPDGHARGQSARAVGRCAPVLACPESAYPAEFGKEADAVSNFFSAL